MYLPWIIYSATLSMLLGSSATPRPAPAKVRRRA
jgi:hypothetical protein